MNVLVTDGENRSALAVTRSLGRKGCSVLVAGIEAGNISSCSKYCRKSFLSPDPLTDGRSFAEEILSIASREKVDVIFPMTEQSIYQLNRVRDRFPKDMILGCAAPETMQAVSNKVELFRLAQSVGVPIPATVFVEGIEDFQEKQRNINDFPVVVKPALSRIPDGDRVVKTGVMYAHDSDDLNKLYESRPALRYPSMIQELIPGPGTGLFTLYDVDHHLALFSHRRLLEKPPSGGVSVLSESVPLDPRMVGDSAKLLSAVGWKGVAMVEFKRDMRDGKAKLMEINGRFWGTLQLAVSSGIDFPALCLDYYLGRKPDEIQSAYAIGYQMKWHLGILDHMIIRIRKCDRATILPPECPTIWKVAGELLKPFNGKTSFDVYVADDIRPFVSELKEYTRNLLRLKR